MTPADRRESRDLQLAERISKLDAMHPPGTAITLGEGTDAVTYGVMNNYAWRKLPNIPTT
jgi:hypothetical protein